MRVKILLKLPIDKNAGRAELRAARQTGVILFAKKTGGIKSTCCPTQRGCACAPVGSGTSHFS